MLGRRDNQNRVGARGRVGNSPVAAIAGSSAMPGRYTVFSWSLLIPSATSGRRAHSVTFRPALAAVIASAVPGASADHGNPANGTALMPLTPAKAARGAVASSGQRGRAAKCSPSISPSRRRSNPAQATITPLSVQSFGALGMCWLLPVNGG